MKKTGPQSGRFWDKVAQCKNSQKCLENCEKISKNQKTKNKLQFHQTGKKVFTGNKKRVKRLIHLVTFIVLYAVGVGSCSG